MATPRLSAPVGSSRNGHARRCNPRSGFQSLDRVARCGRRGDLEDLFDEIEPADQTGFPGEPALEALSLLEPRVLWKTFNLDEIQDLFDAAQRAGLRASARRFLEAGRQAPVLDDGKVPADIRQLVLDRAGHRCQICGTTERLAIDHKVVPWSAGGSSRDPENLQVLCISCNSRKGAAMGSTVASQGTPSPAGNRCNRSPEP
jgi:hypothetical protein